VNAVTFSGTTAMRRTAGRVRRAARAAGPAG
jgi:hypothetical protein